MDTYDDDLAELVQALDLKDAIHVGHSTGGGEGTRHIGRHGTKRVAKSVLIGAAPPLMLKTDANPGGLPIEVFDGIRQGVLSDRVKNPSRRAARHVHDGEGRDRHGPARLHQERASGG